MSKTDDSTLVDAQPRVPGPHRSVGLTLGGLEVVRILGSGTASEVFEAVDRKTGGRFVVKRLRGVTTGFMDVRRFKREAWVMAQLRHPNIMPVVQVHEEADPPYYVMPHREGQVLTTWLEEAPVPQAFAARVAHDVSFGLTEAHRRGIVHRDVKPANIFIEASGRAVLIDFGLARVAGGNGTAIGAIIGTPAYMSPEQCLGEEITDKSDVYSLGVTISHILLGWNPFAATSLSEILRRQISVLPRRIDAELPGRIDSELGELVHRMLAKEPRHRPRAERCLETFAGLVRRFERELGAATKG